MDFEADKEDPKVKKAFEKMNEIVIWYKILGSYPIIKWNIVRFNFRNFFT